MIWNRFWHGLMMAPEADASGGGSSTSTPPPDAPTGPSKEDYEALKAQLADTTRAAEFWQEKASAKPAKAEPKQEEEQEVDLLELMTTGGPKAFEKYMKARGFVSKSEVDQAVNSKAQQLSKEQELSSKYPDLKNSKSDFFKATALHYGDLIKNGVPETLAMEVAAERAELEGIRSGKVKTPAQRTDEEKAERERARLDRIKAQAGDRGGRQPDNSDDDEDLTPEQKRIAIKMLAGDGVTEEQAIEKYKARAKKGVLMGGR